MLSNVVCVCRFVSRHELFPIRAPLLSLEHCIAPFLDKCDEDDDHRITLAEWGQCLQLDEVTCLVPYYKTYSIEGSGFERATN